VIAVIAAFMTLLSELTSNTVITALMMPILAQTAVGAGLDPRLVMMPAAVAASSGFALPVATPPNAIAFSSRLIPMGTMARCGIVVDAVGVAALSLLFHFWGQRVLGIGAELPAWARG
jgi:sodium-dependent dicarboxylate transporter 2/3/5